MITASCIGLLMPKLRLHGQNHVLEHFAYALITSTDRKSTRLIQNISPGSRSMPALGPRSFHALRLGGFPRRSWQDARIRGHAEAVQCPDRNLPDFLGGEEVLGVPAGQRRPHLGRVSPKARVAKFLAWGGTREMGSARCVRCKHMYPQLCRSKQGRKAKARPGLCTFPWRALISLGSVAQIAPISAPGQSGSR
jgi:hypothetical protein